MMRRFVPSFSSSFRRASRRGYGSALRFPATQSAYCLTKRSDFVFMLSEWKIVPGTMRPDPNEMTDFNVLTLNAKCYPATARK